MHGDYINEMLDEVDEASKLLLRLSRFPLLFKTDITNILKKVCKYGVITIEELIPSSQKNKKSRLGTIGCMIGFLLMMILDVALG